MRLLTLTNIHHTPLMEAFRQGRDDCQHRVRAGRPVAATDDLHVQALKDFIGSFLQCSKAPICILSSSTCNLNFYETLLFIST